MSPGEATFNVSKTANELSTQNVHFVDGDMPWSYNIIASDDATTQLSGFSDAQLGDFLSRPIKIQQFQWTPGSALIVTRFNPWENFFSNADVLNKINRYRNLRCNLRVKILVNGNPFYYGRALCSYNPYVEADEVTVNRSFVSQDLIQASQKPHLLLDPTTSQGGEMLLPFIWPENYLDITKAGWSHYMGEVDIHDFDVLGHANGGTDPISVVVFAWAENVKLSVPTTAVAQGGVMEGDLDKFGFPKPFVKQAGRGNNQSSTGEFSKDGLISKPASAIAVAADALSMIPVLAPYAKATSLVSSRLGAMAKLFGYSRPQVLEDTRSYVPRFCGNLANSDAPENLVKLTLDSKNELSVDTRIMGLSGQDELTINSVCQRWSFFRQFDWPESATTDTMLTSMIVAPIYASLLYSAPVLEIHSTALAFGATPFECWQGSIKFRFNVVASEYHRGRLRIVYNPSTSPAGAIPFNQVYSTIVDIKEDRDFEYEVKWADIRAWALNAGVAYTISADIFDDVNPINCGGASDNGSISVYVVNELATPSISAADVKIQVWVAAGCDFAVAVPATKNISELSVFEQQSESAPDVMASAADTSNSPTEVTQITSFGADIVENNQYLVYQGERIVSFRELLRRYHYHNSYWPAGIGVLADNRVVAFDISDFPFPRGWEVGGQDTATDSSAGVSAYNFCTMTLLNYLTPAYACRRGGLRHKVIFTQLGNALRSPMLHVARHSITGAPNQAKSYPIEGAIVGDRRKELQATERSSLGGTHCTVSAQNPVLEYETGFYTNGQRFLPGRFLANYNAFASAHEVSLDIAGGVQSNDYRIDKYVSTAEDFQLGMFVGAPILYQYADPVAVS